MLTAGEIVEKEVSGISLAEGVLGKVLTICIGFEAPRLFLCKSVEQGLPASEID